MMKHIRPLLAIFCMLSMNLSLEATIFSWLKQSTKQCIFTFSYLLSEPFQRYKNVKFKYNFNEKLLAQQVGTNLKTTLRRIKSDQFLIGASTSEHQCSPKCTPEICSWSWWSQKRNLATPSEKSTMNLWDNYQAYIDYAKDTLHLNAFRFSIEWPLVQPHGDFDNSALDHYADQFVYCIKKGITPVVCFHHYTDPLWFISKGGFEKNDNVEDFVVFCNTVYASMMKKLSEAIKEKSIEESHLETLKNRPPLFATFNSPEGYAFKGYRQNDGPPSNPDKQGFYWVSTVLGNMMYAHVETYLKLHETYENFMDDQNIDAETCYYLPKPCVGFLKNIHQLDATNMLAQPTCCFGDLYQNECIYQFFTTGHFNAGLGGNNSLYHPDAKKALDFIGLNYYSNRHMNAIGKKIPERKDVQTDNENYCIYPAGLYRAIIELSDRLALPVGKKRKDNFGKAIPIFVTENGIATSDEQKRGNFYSLYLNALQKAVQDGYDVRGYLTWTLADNYEWQKMAKCNDIPTTQQDRRIYGLCTVSKDGKTLTKKNGAQYLIDFAKTVAQA